MSSYVRDEDLALKKITSSSVNRRKVSELNAGKLASMLTHLRSPPEQPNGAAVARPQAAQPDRILENSARKRGGGPAAALNTGGASSLAVVATQAVSPSPE